MATLQLIALLLVVLGGYLWLRALRARRHRLQLLTTPNYTVGGLRDTADPPALAEVGAAAEEVPSGALTAPYSGTACVWFRVEATRHHYEEETGDRLELSRLMGLRSYTPFRLRAGADTLTCVPDWAEVDAAELSYDRFVPCEAPPADPLVPARGGAGPGTATSTAVAGPAALTPGVTYREWIIRPGQHLFVRGHTGRDTDGEIRLESTESEPLSVSTRSEREQLHDDRTREALGFSVLPVAVAVFAGLLLLA